VFLNNAIIIHRQNTHIQNAYLPMTLSRNPCSAAVTSPYTRFGFQLHAIRATSLLIEIRIASGPQRNPPCKYTNNKSQESAQRRAIVQNGPNDHERQDGEQKSDDNKKGAVFVNR
jgi:hypothetical protein